MGKRAAKDTAGKDGTTVEIVTRTTERKVGSGDEVDLNGADDGAGADDGLDAMDDLGDNGARLEIRRTSPAEFAGYVGTYSRDGFTPDRLMEEWGGGKFTIRVRDANGTFVGLRHVTLAGKPKNKEAPAAAAPVAAAPPDNGMANVLASIQAANVAAQAATKDQIGLLTTLLTSLIAKEPPKAPPAPDPLAMLEKAASILRPRGETGDSMTAFMKGLDIGRDLSGGGGEPGMASMFMEGIKTIKETAVLQNRRPPLRRAPPGTVAAEAPAISPPNKAEEAEPMSDTMKQIAWIRQQAVFLVLQASREKSPELYAELFVDNLPAFLPPETVLAQMKAGDALAKLGLLNANVLKYPEWFEEFRAAVVQFIEAPAEPEVDNEPAPGGQTFEHGEEGGEGGGES